MSQGSLNVPTTGPDQPTSFAGQINTALDAVISKNSGSSAPANFPTSGGAATQWQDWIDTSPGGGIVDLKIFDGASWIVRASFDTTNHFSMPKVGGGSNSISGAAGGTVDLGSVRGAYVTITATVPGNPITSFGANAALATGESKFVEAAATGILTFNAVSMILPGAADLSFGPGDTWQMLYLGSGKWRMFHFMKAAGWGHATGDVFTRHGTGVVNGAVRLNGRTIGDAASGATERANADTANLWILLYLQDANLTVSGGRSGSTRATAITDYNAHKTLTLPDDRSRVEAGLGDMGNSNAARLASGVTGEFSSGNETTLGSVGGEDAHTTSIAEMPSHNHGGTLANGSSPISGAGVGGSIPATGTSFAASSIASQGGGGAHNNMQPFILRTRYMAL